MDFYENKADRLKSRARNSVSHCVGRSVRPSVGKKKTEEKIEKKRPSVGLSATPYFLGVFKQFEGRNVRPTDKLTNTVTY